MESHPDRNGQLVPPVVDSTGLLRHKERGQATTAAYFADHQYLVSLMMSGTSSFKYGFKIKHSKK